MENTARRALSELIDQLCQPAAPEPEVEVPTTVAALLTPEPAAEPDVVEESPAADPAVVEVPQQRTEPAAPVAVPAAFTVLPGGARSAILWRSR